MNDDATVNSQVMDSVSSIVSLSTAQSPAQSQGMLDAVFLETLGMAMYNAVNRQQNAGMVSAAAVTAACAKMLATPFRILPPPPPTPPAPEVNPLPGPPPQASSPAAAAATALATGEVAVQSLKAQAQELSTETAAVQASLQKLAADATSAATPPPPAAPTPPAPTQ